MAYLINEITFEIINDLCCDWLNGYQYFTRLASWLKSLIKVSQLCLSLSVCLCLVGYNYLICVGH